MTLLAKETLDEWVKSATYQEKQIMLKKIRDYSRKHVNDVIDQKLIGEFIRELHGQ